MAKETDPSDGWTFVTSSGKSKHRKGTQRPGSNTPKDTIQQLLREFQTFNALNDEKRHQQCTSLFKSILQCVETMIKTDFFVRTLQSLIQHLSNGQDDCEEDDDENISNSDDDNNLPSPFVDARELLDTSSQPDISWRDHILSLVSTHHPTLIESITPDGFCSPHAANMITTGFGIGSPDRLYEAKYQLGLFLIYSAVLRIPFVEVYDPMFSPLDIYLFRRLGLTVLQNTEGQLLSPAHKMPAAHHFFRILYLPHCNIALSSNAMQSIWNHLSKTIIISNSMRFVFGNMHLSTAAEATTSTTLPSPKQPIQVIASIQDAKAISPHIYFQSGLQAYIHHLSLASTRDTRRDAPRSPRRVGGSTGPADSMFALLEDDDDEAGEAITNVGWDPSTPTTTHTAIPPLCMFPFLRETPLPTFHPLTKAFNNMAIHSYPNVPQSFLSVLSRMPLYYQPDGSNSEVLTNKSTEKEMYSSIK